MVVPANLVAPANLEFGTYWLLPIWKSGNKVVRYHSILSGFSEMRIAASKSIPCRDITHILDSIRVCLAESLN